MYTPGFSNLYSLWNGEDHGNSWDNVRIRRQAPSSTNSSENDEHKKYIRLLFAPPLLAYSPDYPGANTSHFEYTIKTTTAMAADGAGAATGSRARLLAHMHINSPSAQHKLDQLELIRSAGFSTLRPIGIERTMEEISAERAKRLAAQDGLYDDVSYNHTAENVPTDVSHGDVDLDANVVNADDDESLGDDYGDDDNRVSGMANSSNVSLGSDGRFPELRAIGMHVAEASPLVQAHANNLVDEGFMADDVEYQDDHSSVDPGLHQMLVSGPGSAATTFTAPTSVSARMEAPRGSVVQDDEYDDLDMVIEE